MDEIDGIGKITIHVSNRTGRKLMTSVYGFGIEYDLPKILKYFQKQFHCTGSIEKSNEFGEVIKLTGNHKTEIADFLVNEEICKSSDIAFRGL